MLLLLQEGYEKPRVFPEQVCWWVSLLPVHSVLLQLFQLQNVQDQTLTDIYIPFPCKSSVPLVAPELWWGTCLLITVYITLILHLNMNHCDALHNWEYFALHLPSRAHLALAECPIPAIKSPLPLHMSLPQDLLIACKHHIKSVKFNEMCALAILKQA